MSTIQDMFQQSQLAEAAYASFLDSAGNLLTGRADIVAALQVSGFSEAQATTFVDQWEIVDHLPNTDSGFSATVFRNRVTGQYEFVIRGSESIATFDGLEDDWIATNFGDIGDLGIAAEQALDMYNYWQSLNTAPGQSHLAAALDLDLGRTALLTPLWVAAQLNPVLGKLAYEAYKADLLSEGFLVDGGEVKKLVLGDSSTLLAGTQLETGSGKLLTCPSLEVVGHSLGGHLAMILGRLESAQITDVTAFNAPYFDPLTSDKLTNWFFNALSQAEIDAYGYTSIGTSFDDAQVQHLVVDNDVVHAIGALQPGTEVEIFSEGDIPIIKSLTAAHSIEHISDSLAIYSLFAGLDPDVNIDDVTSILKASSSVGKDSLEFALSAIGKLFGKSYQDRETTRDAFYQNLYDLQEELLSSSAGLLTVESLVGQSRNEIVAKAQTDIAYRYAIANLNPFAITGDDALYAQANAYGELNLYDPATGEGALTERYLRDRAAMLAWQMQFNIDDLQPEGNTFYKFQGGTPYYFRDMSTDARISIGGGYRLDMLQPLTEFSHVVFGSENNDPIFGQGKNDWLYGGAGHALLLRSKAWKEAA